MASSRNPVPSYLKHASGKARAVWTDTTGIRRFRLLPGPFKSKESLEAFGRHTAELAATPIAAASDTSALTVQQVLLAYRQHAITYYGEGRELDALTRCIKAIRLLYGETAAAEFGPAKLKVVRQSIVDAGHCRQQINKRIDRIRRMFRWAVAEELVPSAVYEGLRALPPLMPGRGGVKEGTPRKPADPAAVEKVLPLLAPGPRAIVQLLRLTGARPTELLTLRPCDVDRSGEVWSYTPKSHKGSWKGRNRAIHLGREAQALLAPWLVGTPHEGYVFTPQRSEELRSRERAEKRVTPLFPSHSRRNAEKRAASTRHLADRFDHQAISLAVRRACIKAGVEFFSPYCLRHLRAVELRERFGLEVTRAVLGQSTLSMAGHYSRAADDVLSRKAAAEVG